MAVGSLAAALLSARRARPRMRVLLVALAGFTVSTALLATAPSYLLFAIYLVPTGLAALTALTTANAMVQISVDPVMRGRVMALYMAIFMGGTPVGAPVLGWIGDAWGPRWTIGIGTVAVGLSLVAVAVWFARRQNVAVTFQTRAQPSAAHPGRAAARPDTAAAAAARSDRRGCAVSFKFRHRVTVAALALLRRHRGRRLLRQPLRASPAQVPGAVSTHGAAPP